PPLTGCPRVAVGHAEQRCVAKFRSRRRPIRGAVGGPVLAGSLCLYGSHSLPAAALDGLQPHGGALVFGAPGVTHPVHIHTQGVTEAALHIARWQIDEEYRQLAVSSHAVLRYGASSPVSDEVARSDERSQAESRANRWYGTD